jgi:hypothetical protein
MLVAVGVVAAVGAGLVLGLSSPSLPRVPTELNAPTRELAIRPGRIDYTGDGTGILAGADVSTLRSRLRWSSWTRTRALGQGDNLISHCQASGCLPSQIRSYPIRLEAWRPASLHGARVFTRLTIWYRGARPAGTPGHYTFSDLYDGGWTLGPRSARGYCVDTYGAPVAAGCANVASLP